MTEGDPRASEALAPGRSFRRHVLAFTIVTVSLAAWYAYGVSASGVAERLGPELWLWLGGLLFCALADPPFVQYVALRRAGLRLSLRREPAYDSPYPRSSWEARGYRLTKGQFTAAYLAPPCSSPS